MGLGGGGFGGGGFDGAVPEMDDGGSLVIYISNVIFPISISQSRLRSNYSCLF